MMTKIEIPSEPIQVAQEAQKIDSYRQRAGQALELVQNVATAYNDLGLGELTQLELSYLIKQGPEQLVREKVAGTEPVKVGGLTFSREKVQDLVELPDLRKLENALSSLQEFQRREAMAPYAPKALAAVAIVEGAAVENTEYLSQVEAGYTTFMSTEAEKEAYLYLKEVAAILDYLTAKYGMPFLGSVLSQKINYTGFGQDGYKTDINLGYLKGQLAPLRGR